jgi:hypothetical protein
MSTKVDSYHLTQFVLHVANDSVTDWNAFMNKLEKMYKKHIPENVLHGLHSKNIPELSTLCLEQLQQLENKRVIAQERDKEHALKVQRWIERVNDGNMVAWLAYLEERRKKEAAKARQK